MSFADRKNKTVWQRSMIERQITDYLIFKLLKISMIQKINVTALDCPIHMDFLHVFDLKITERKFLYMGKNQHLKFYRYT